MKKLTYLNTVAIAKVGSLAVASAKVSILLLFSLFLVYACNNDKKQIETLTKATETIHDEAMKDMAEMNRVAREIKASMIAMIMTPEQSAQYEKVLTSIGNAENNMMDWMKNYKNPDELKPAEALQYIQEQKTLIEKNHAEIKAALAAGKELQGK